MLYISFFVFNKLKKLWSISNSQINMDYRFPRTKTNITSAKEVSFSSSDQLNRRDEHANVLGGVNRHTQNTFDLLAERCHGGKRKTGSPQSSDSPDSIKIKTNYALEEKTTGHKSLLPKDHQKLISDNMTRTSSLKSKYGSGTNGKSTKGQKVECGRQFSDADLASAVAVSSAFAGNITFLPTNGIIY